MIAPTSVSTIAWKGTRSPNSSGTKVKVAPAALPMPRARWPALRPIEITKNQCEVVFASTMRFFTISTPTWRAVWKPKVSTCGGRSRSLSIVLGTWTTRMRPAECGVELHRRVGGVVAADRDQLRRRRGCRSALTRVLEQGGIAGRIGARDPEVRAAAEVDAAHVVDGERRHVLDVALHDPVEAVADAEHPDAFERAPDGGGADDAVDAGGGAAADEDREVRASTHAASMASTGRDRQRSSLVVRPPPR